MSQRGGFALLFVLAATMMVFATATMAIAVLMDARQQKANVQHSNHLFDALAAGEQLSLLWLAQHADHLVLSPDDTHVALLHEQFQSNTGNGLITIDLYDACAAIPAPSAHAGGSLRSALPSPWTAVQIPGYVHRAQNGLASDWLETIILPENLRCFPQLAHRTPSVDWSTIGTIALPATTTTTTSQVGLATLISPHSMGAINLNTAPPALLQIAFRVKGLGGVDDIIRRRQRGLFIAAVPEAPEVPGLPTQAQDFHFVTTSDVWYAHISATWHTAQRSWWVVIASNSTEHMIVQRHDADR